MILSPRDCVCFPFRFFFLGIRRKEYLYTGMEKDKSSPLGKRLFFYIEGWNAEGILCFDGKNCTILSFCLHLCRCTQSRNFGESFNWDNCIMKLLVCVGDNKCEFFWVLFQSYTSIMIEIIMVDDKVGRKNFTGNS